MTKLTLRTPFNDLWTLQDEIDRLFWGVGKRRGRGGSDGDAEMAVWAPTCDICEDKESVKMAVELPGLEKKDVKITVNDGVLTIKGDRKFENEQKRDDYYKIERSYGTFSRSFTLPTTVDAEKINASMKNGVLELLIPKKEEAKPKEIEINVG